MIENKEQFKKEFKVLLHEINSDNFSKSYDDLLDVIIKYKEKGLNRDTAINILSEIDSEVDMNDYQEDVFLEISSRVEGFSSATNNINW